MPQKLTIEMKKDKETKGTIRWAATKPDSPVPTLYVQRPAAEKLADTLTVTIEG